MQVVRSKRVIELQRNLFNVYMKHIHLVFDMEELIRYVLFRDKLVEGYELTGQIKEKLFDFRDKVRSGKLDIGDQPYFFEPKDLL